MALKLSRRLQASQPSITVSHTNWLKNLITIIKPLNPSQRPYDHKVIPMSSTFPTQYPSYTSKMALTLKSSHQAFQPCLYNHSGKPSTTSKAGGMKSPLPGLMLAPPLGGVSLALLPLVLERPSLSFFNHRCVFLLCNIFLYCAFGYASYRLDIISSCTKRSISSQ